MTVLVTKEHVFTDVGGMGQWWPGGGRGSWPPMFRVMRVFEKGEQVPELVKSHLIYQKQLI